MLGVRITIRTIACLAMLSVHRPPRKATRRATFRLAAMQLMHQKLSTAMASMRLPTAMLRWTETEMLLRMATVMASMKMGEVCKHTHTPEKQVWAQLKFVLCFLAGENGDSLANGHTNGATNAVRSGKILACNKLHFTGVGVRWKMNSFSARNSHWAECN